MSAIFSGRYQQFDDIYQADNYNQLNIIQQLHEAARSRYDSKSFFPEPISNEYNHIRDITSLCITMLCAEKNERVRVLDIGGGFGVSFIELLKRTQLNHFDYTVCEINSFVNYYQTNPFFREDNITILESTKKISNPFDLLILGSSLQYFPDTDIAIHNLVDTAQHPNYILITHTPVTQHPSFVTTQVNMDQKKIPNWIFNIDTLINLFNQNHYQCIYKSAIYREHLFDDFEDAENLYRSANLLFKKKWGTNETNEKNN